jgi:hypothetical protein
LERSLKRENGDDGKKGNYYWTLEENRRYYEFVKNNA